MTIYKSQMFACLDIHDKFSPANGNIKGRLNQDFLHQFSVFAISA